MIERAVLHKEIDRLPQKYFGEVIDFVGYLQHKAQQVVQNDNENEVETYKAMAADKEREKEAREWRNPLLGLGKAMGSTLTLDRFMRMQQEEIAREIENDERLVSNK